MFILNYNQNIEERGEKSYNTENVIFVKVILEKFSSFAWNLLYPLFLFCPGKLIIVDIIY